jgi:hypothetical protein
MSAAGAPPEHCATGDMDTHLAEVKLVTDGQTIFRVAQRQSSGRAAQGHWPSSAIDEITHGAGRRRG